MVYSFNYSNSTATKKHTKQIFSYFIQSLTLSTNMLKPLQISWGEDFGGKTHIKSKIDSNNRLQGYYVMYGPKGNVWYTGTYRDGKKDGEFLIYDNQSGKLIKRSIYKNDEETSRTLFVEDK
jgi:hypothetical protein